MSKTYMENIVEDISYESLGDWCLPKISSFSHKKSLFPYQENAIKNVAKILYLYFNNDNGKELLYSKCVDLGMNNNSFNVNEYLRPIDKERGLTNRRYLLLQDYYSPTIDEDKKFIEGSCFFNRTAFWMATGSGKSIVLIKVIEYLYYLQSKGLIPKKDIMLLLPREDLINQFKAEIKEYNLYKEVRIELVNLKDYEKDKNYLTLMNGIKVYYYRSDLIRDERKENILDFKDYDNNGNWYVFLDEAHRGETGISLVQDYVSILSRNGYLFNFSATFTDSIDYTTTCYNFNLEKFINAGYGKNIYLSKSYFDFQDDRDDFSQREKQKQVLKSLITFTLVKQSKKEGIYHNPLLVTLVNSVNTDDSDLLMFFNKLEEIASGKIDEELFIETREELKKDFDNKSYIFGDEKCDFDISLIDKITLDDILDNVFNTNTNGKIEILEGEKGKEIVLKLETSESPFALIKIGDADRFQREKLGNNYSIISGYDTRNYFKDINRNENINILLGSRSFYEGWDSNRPNIINFINIGGRDAKKYVLQAIGRGVRIEPYKGNRKRLPYSDENKNHLLETLFIYATDKNGVKSILETVEEQKYIEEYEIPLYKTDQKIFDLLIPKFKSADDREEIAYFNISRKSKDRFKEYFNYFDKNVLLLTKGISKENYEFLSENINNEKLFQIDNQKDYNDYDILMDNIINHISFKNMVVENIQELKDEIIHFKHVKVLNLTDQEVEKFKKKVNKVKNYEKVDKKKLASDYANDLITEEEFNRLINAKAEESFKDLKIIKLAQHYYLPLIYSEKEKVEYIKNIIKVDSEVRFIKNLNNYIKNNVIDCAWMFSRIDENKDMLYIPYFLRKENRYSKFYPDFIFWIKRDNDYKIVFVDPKGTSNTDYINKVDEFERIFYEDKKPKIYNYENYNIKFDLKLVAKNTNEVPKKYEKFWLGEEDFSFINI